jgi:flagellar biosynthetic protein FliR
LEIPLGVVFNSIEAFLLIFVRMTGLFVVTPIFGRRNIPVYFKVGFSFLLALILMNTIPAKEIEYGNSIYGYALLVAKEFLTGIVLGYVAYLVFTAVYLAGQIIDMQIGFGVVNVVDPMSNIQVPITSNFYFILSMMVFLMGNGHHALIRALFESYKFIPLGGAVFNNNLLNDILRVFADTFTIGFKICAPIVATTLITDVALGVISRTIPQLNVFIVGMPAKIVFGLAIMLITIPVFLSLTGVLMNEMNTEMANFMKDMGMVK